MEVAAQLRTLTEVQDVPRVATFYLEEVRHSDALTNHPVPVVRPLTFLSCAAPAFGRVSAWRRTFASLMI